MRVSFKLTQNEFIRVSFFLLFGRVVYLGYFVILSLSTLAYIFLPNPTISKEEIFLGIPVPILILTCVPFFLYFIFKKTYKADKQRSKLIEYHFEQHFYEIKGESFSSQLKWDTVLKVEEKKNWILIYVAKKSAHPIPKKYLSQEQIIELKNILNSNSVKNNL